MARARVTPSGARPAASRRAEIFERDAHTCVYCGRSAPEVELSVDHVEPKMRGGDNSRGNVVTACTACNLAKGGLPAWSYLAEREEERARFLARASYVWPRLRAAVVEAAEKAGARAAGRVRAGNEACRGTRR